MINKDVDILTDTKYEKELNRISVQYGESFNSLEDWFFSTYYKMKEDWPSKSPDIWATKAIQIIERKLSNPDKVYLGKKTERITVRVSKEMKDDFERACRPKQSSEVLRKLMMQKIAQWRNYGT